MFYALRRRAGSSRETLVEFTGKADLEAVAASGVNVFTSVSAKVAHEWVSHGGEHETGLFIDDGKMKYAAADK